MSGYGIATFRCLFDEVDRLELPKVKPVPFERLGGL